MQLLTYPSFITGDIIQYGGSDHILRSVNFAAGKATLEEVRTHYRGNAPGRYVFGKFVTVSMGSQRKFLNLLEFEEVLNRKINYVFERVSLSGKNKLSKELLARLQVQRDGLLGIARLPEVKKVRKARKQIELKAAA